MRNLASAALISFVCATPAFDQGSVIDSLDTLRFQPPKEKGRAELVEGHTGKAIQFTFEAEGRGTFFTSNIHGTPEWDKADGFSFWVKGDGSTSLGGLEFIYDEDYAVRYDYAFPIKSKEWTKVTVAWSDLIPVLPGARAKPLGAGNLPSKLSGLWIGKWWYWGDYPAHSFALDDIRLEEHITRDAKVWRTLEPLARVQAKLKVGKPITIVTMGDSLTDFHHWANRQVAWPNLLRDALKSKYGSTVTIVNPAIGGTQLRQNLILIPRWLEQTPAPDLVTVFFGGNDWEGGMRGPAFEDACTDAIDRIRRATNGKSDVLLMTTAPSVSQWETKAELATAVRKAARSRNAALADTEAAFIHAGATNKERLYVNDGTHLSPAGHELVVNTILKAIEAAGH